MNNPALWLRVAAVLTFVHAVLHTIGGVFGKPAPGNAAMVAATMRDNSFQIMGATRTYADFNLGLGLAVTLFLTLCSILFWQLGAIARHDPSLVRPILLIFAIGFVGFAVVSYRYFFFAPVVIELLIAACLAIPALVSTAVPAR